METSSYYITLLTYCRIILMWVTKPFNSPFWVTFWNLTLLKQCTWSQFLVFARKKKKGLWVKEGCWEVISLCREIYISVPSSSPLACWYQDDLQLIHQSFRCAALLPGNICGVPKDWFCFLRKFYLFTSVFKVVKK